MDIYQTLNDLKEGQEKMMDLLNNQTEGNSQKRIYDLVDLQNILHVSKRTLATWRQQGILPHTKIGNKIWVSEEQLKTFLEEHSNSQARNNLLNYNR